MAGWGKTLSRVGMMVAAEREKMNWRKGVEEK